MSAIERGTDTTNRDSEQSESARLHKLPGFTKMQKQLFVNLMSAHPGSFLFCVVCLKSAFIMIITCFRFLVDESSKNIRVPSNAGKLAYLASFDQVQNSSMASYAYDFGANNNEISLDRSTVKDISRLVIDRDVTSKSKTSQSSRRYVKPKRGSLTAR